MNKRIFSKSFVFAILLTGILSSQTPFSATYNLSGGGNDVTSFAYNGTSYATLTFGNLTKNGITSSSSTGNFRGSAWPTGATSGSDVFSGAIDLAKYISFTITPQSGYEFTISTISFGIGRSSTGPRQSQWRGSDDSYAAPLTNYTSLNGSVTNTSGVLQTPDANSGYTGNVLTITSGYSSKTGTAELRFYMLNSEFGSGTGGLHGSITITGTYELSLPVELTSFTASLIGSVTKLNWNTATEQNNLGFEVQRSVNGNAFSKIAFVDGHGTTNAPQSYSYVDASAAAKASYRLKQIDRDGKFTYSQTVEVNNAGAVASYGLGQNYPNPFNPATTISYALPIAGQVSLKVYDMLGKEVATLVNGVRPAGENTAVFDASKVPSGMYFYTLRTAGFSATKKMLLVK